jgi:SAM-dependent methyltransferase
MMVASRPSAGEVPAVTAGGHFERVAAVYESLRRIDEAPARAIGQLLPAHPVTGLDIGCGTGRYSRLLRGLLPAGSRLAAADISAAMLAQLQAGNHGRARAVAPLPAAAEQLPLRAASLDVVTAFNCVHHFDLGRFLAAAARVLRPGGQLFIYTRTPAAERANDLGPLLPRLHRARAAAAQRGRAPGGHRGHQRAPPSRNTVLQAPALKHGRTAQRPSRGAPLLDLLPLHTAGTARVHRDLPGPLAQPRGLLG